jgi:O-antigen/teichoic acid export membrane protein
MLQSLTIIPMAYIRVQQRPWLYISLSLARVVLQLSLNIYFIVIQDMKVEGVVYSAVISTFILGAISLVYLYRHVGFATDRVLMKGMLNFSFPLVLASIASFYSAYGDRYFLRIYDDLSDVGIYSLAYKFGFLLVALVWDPFTKTWDVRRYEIFENPDTEETYNDNFMVMIGALIFGALGIAIFLDEILMIMSSPEYWPAAKVAPIIVLAYVFQQAGSFNCFPIFAKGNTKDIAKGHWICAAVITVGYLTLIPKFGMYGAAWSTLIGFLAYFTWIIYKGRPLLDMELSWNKAALLLAFATLLYLISMQIGGPMYLRIAAKVVLACLYGAVLWMTAGDLQRHMMLSFFRR